MTGLHQAELPQRLPHHPPRQITPLPFPQLGRIAPFIEPILTQPTPPHHPPHCPVQKTRSPVDCHTTGLPRRLLRARTGRRWVGRKPLISPPNPSPPLGKTHRFTNVFHLPPRTIPGSHSDMQTENQTPGSLHATCNSFTRNNIAPKTTYPPPCPPLQHVGQPLQN